MTEPRPVYSVPDATAELVAAAEELIDKYSFVPISNLDYVSNVWGRLAQALAAWKALDKSGQDVVR